MFSTPSQLCAFSKASLLGFASATIARKLVAAGLKSTDELSEKRFQDLLHAPSRAVAEWRHALEENASLGEAQTVVVRWMVDFVTDTR